MYLLTRDDGAELRVSGGVWEAALEIAYHFGWRPAGTETPRSPAWRDGRRSSSASAWDRQDYFSQGSQHVGREDARALARAIHRALPEIPERGSQRDERPQAAAEGESSPVPSRTTAIADGLSVPSRNLMSRFAAFAARDGFTIDGADG